MSLTPEVAALIKDEEERLEKVLHSLLSQREIAKRRLRHESERAQSFTSQIVASRRETEKQMLASDEAVSYGLRDRKREEIGEIDRLLKRPYFARMILAEDQGGSQREIEFLIGTIGNSDCRIIDWRRAPISKLYYEYKEGDHYDEHIQARDRAGTILLRHKLDIEDGELVSITCRLGRFSKTDGVWGEALGRSRGQKPRRPGELPDVLSLITPEQYRAITEEAESAVIIHGFAGSGKTTVALYRLSWLLTPGNSELAATDALILVRSKPLASYISRSLSSLDIANVPCHTIDGWVKKLIRGISAELLLVEEELPPSIERLLRSTALMKCIEQYVDEQRERVLAHVMGLLSARFSAVSFPVSSSGSSSLPSSGADLREKYQAFASPVRAPLELTDAASELLAADDPLQEELAKCRRRLSLFREDLQQILKHPARVLEEDDSFLLDRALVLETAEHLERSRALNRVTLSEAVLILLLAERKGYRLHGASGEANKKRHILVDEVQDFSASELALIVSQVQDISQLTLSGDSAQAISGTMSFQGWEALRKFRNLGDASRFVELTVSHRSTGPIMRLADHVLGEDRTRGGRPGKAPLWFLCGSEDEGVREIRDWLIRISERFPDSTTAVICDTRGTARYAHSLLSPTFSSAVQLWDGGSFQFEEGITVFAVQDAKGLEFENVLVWNPSTPSFPNSQLARNMLYVAMTRAEERLCLVTWGAPSALLPPFTSRLVRGVKPEPEDKEEAPPPFSRIGREPEDSR